MNTIILVVAGAISAAVLCLLLHKLAAESYKEILTLLLVAIAAIYIGPVIGSSESSAYTEISFAVLLIILSIFALRGPLPILAAGYFLHGAWDVIHPALLPHVLPHWYAPLCVGFDMTVAVYLIQIHRSRIMGVS